MIWCFSLFLFFFQSHKTLTYESYSGFSIKNDGMENNQVFTCWWWDERPLNRPHPIPKLIQGAICQSKTDPSVWRVFHKSLCSRSTLLQKHVVPLWVLGGGEQNCFQKTSRKLRRLRFQGAERSSLKCQRLSAGGLTSVQPRVKVFKSNSLSLK